MRRLVTACWPLAATGSGATVRENNEKPDDKSAHKLAFLLLNRQSGVHLHASTLRCRERVIALAGFVHAKLAGVEGSDLSDLPHDAPPRDRPLATGSKLAAGSPEELTPEAEAKLHEFLASLPKGKTYDPTNCPPWMWQTFKELLSDALAFLGNKDIRTRFIEKCLCDCLPAERHMLFGFGSIPLWIGSGSTWRRSSKSSPRPWTRSSCTSMLRR